MKDPRDGTQGEVIATSGKQIKLTSMAACAG